jgi:4-amino-4-deoxy-L-arabinose transferase-like glycosyltransferase
MNPHLVYFLFGMAGNSAIEVVRLLGYAQRSHYHNKYKDWRFWLARVLLLVLAGVMALAYSLTGFPYALVAFHVGVAATLLVERMANKPPPTIE